MKPNWKHGVFVGVLLFTLAVLNEHYKDKQSHVDKVEQAFVSIPEPPEIKLPEPVQLPFGGRKLIPSFRFVALYGNGDYPTLGSLGEQNMQESITRAKNLALEYQVFSEETVIPAFEIIATVAAAELTEDNDYSREIPIEKLRPWIDAAQENNMYVLIDLQPGRSTFLTQAKKYEELLKKPHVGLALDPEWRLQKESDRHLVSIGSVSAAEINETSEWLANIVKEHDLPQKMLMIHQFKLSMITERETLKTDREEIAYVLHMDGHGAPGSKTGTWNMVKENLPANLYLGWKNFYDEDKPTPTPEQTMQQTPKPWFISYQ